MRRFLFGLLVLALLPVTAFPHYAMLFPSGAKAREETTILYQWGHPFEHQLFDAATPARVRAVSPDGKRIDLTGKLKEHTVPSGEAGKTVKAFQIAFTPEERGDYVLIANLPPVWMEEDQRFFSDSVKTILHVQAQKGWDRAAGEVFEILPLTRPYGLRPGQVFTGQAVFDGKPLAGALVEVERYNPTPPDKLPPDEHITYTVKTDPSGVFSFTPLDDGWWCFTATKENGTKDRAGKAYPLVQRASLWVPVDPAAKK